MNSSTTIIDITVQNNNTIVNVYDIKGNLVTSTKCDGHREEKTYNEKGNRMTYRYPKTYIY
jgi:YD repeat-containing protein